MAHRCSLLSSDSGTYGGVGLGLAACLVPPQATTSINAIAPLILLSLIPMPMCFRLGRTLGWGVWWVVLETHPHTTQEGDPSNEMNIYIKEFIAGVS